MQSQTNLSQISPEELGANQEAPVQSAATTDLASPILQTEDLLATLQEETAWRKQRRRNINYVIGAVTCVLTACLLGWIVHGVVTGHWGRFPWQLFQVLTFAGIASAAVSRRHKETVRSAAALDDIRLVGPLADLLDCSDKKIRAVVVDALIRLLPRLRASEAAMLDDQNRANLHEHVHINKEPTLVLAILGAMEQVGDSRDLAYVEKLSRLPPFNANNKRVCSFAAACLPAVRQRAELELAAQTLLRAASVPDDLAATLLRPAHGAGEADPSMLLRPSSGQTAA